MGNALALAMSKTTCECDCYGIRRTLEHALSEHAKAPIQGVVLVANTVEESHHELMDLGRQLSAAGVPVHVFHDGTRRSETLRMLAMRTGGEYFKFRPHTAEAQLNAVTQAVLGDNKALLALPSRCSDADT